MKFFILIVLMCSLSHAENPVKSSTAYEFLKRKSEESRPTIIYNEYEDIISGSIAFVAGNIGYFTTESSTLKIAYSGVQTVGIVAVGHGIYDYYYPHFETRLLGLMNRKKMTRGDLSDGYISLLGEMNRAKRLSLLWSSSLLTAQYGLNAFLGKDIPSDMKDIYFFLGGVNAIVAVYSYLNISDYEEYFLQQRNTVKTGLFILPDNNGGTKTGIGLTMSW
jgi:hypothetical protein